MHHLREYDRNILPFVDVVDDVDASFAIAVLTQMDIDNGNVLFQVGATALVRKINYKLYIGQSRSL